MRTTVIIIALALLASVAGWAQPKTQPPAFIAGKPHVSVSGVVRGKCAEYVCVGDTNVIRQSIVVGFNQRTQKPMKRDLMPKYVSRLTYVRAYPGWQSLKVGQSLTLKDVDCFLINQSESLRTVQYWRP